MARLVLAISLAAALALPAGASAAVPSGFVGMTSEDLLPQDTSYQDRMLRMQRRSGVRLLRQTFTWAEIEGLTNADHQSPSLTYRWGFWDRLVLSAARNGITVLPVLFKAPPHESSGPAGARETHPPRNPSAMGAFAAAAVARFGPGGSLWRENPGVPARPIRAWQVWNEPSLKAYWGGKPSARAYVDLLRAVNDAIKRVDRRAEVVTGGIPPSVLSGSVPIKRYIDQMYRAGGKRAFDTLAINSYARSAGELGRLLRSVREIMNRRGDRRAKIWITELGWCDKGPRHRFCVGARKQSRLIRSSLALIRKERRRLRLRGFVYYSWIDGRPYAPAYQNLWGLHTGLLKLDGRSKPALKTFAGAARRFR
jgi:hypothetical protein